MNIKDLSGPYKHVFMDEAEVREELKLMERDPLLNTRPVLVKDTASSVRMVSFQEQHMAYLQKHPKLNPEHYLANLRTMIKIR